MFGPEVFRKQMYCVEEVNCDIVGSFRLPHCDSSQGGFHPTTDCNVASDLFIISYNYVVSHSGFKRVITWVLRFLRRFQPSRNERAVCSAENQQRVTKHSLLIGRSCV